MIVCFGVEIWYLGMIIILGDFNFGGFVIVDGDIFVWGCLWGVVYVGVKGNFRSVIMIL